MLINYIPELIWKISIFSFRFAGYKLRNQLAAIDFNKHTVRKLARTAVGEQRLFFMYILLYYNYCIAGNISIHCVYRYKCQYSKRTKTWQPVSILEPKEYLYIPELLVNIFEKRTTVPGAVTQNMIPAMQMIPAILIRILQKHHDHQWKNCYKVTNHALATRLVYKSDIPFVNIRIKLLLYHYCTYLAATI